MMLLMIKIDGEMTELRCVRVAESDLCDPNCPCVSGAFVLTIVTALDTDIVH